MAKVDVYNLDGAVIGQIELSDAVFGIEPNQSVMHQVVKNQLANRRQGTGSTRSAQYVGGGIIFGPKPRDYHYTVSKKVRRLAIKSALSTKLQEKQLIVVENFELAEAKTKNFVTALKKLNVTDRVLVVENEKNVNLELAARNIAKVQLSRANTINVFDLLKNEVLLISKAAVEKIQEVYA